MKRILKELHRRLFEKHYRILEVERFKSGVKWYYIQKLGLFGWIDVGDICDNIEDARKALKREKNMYAVDIKVIEES